MYARNRKTVPSVGQQICQHDFICVLSPMYLVVVLFKLCR